MGNAENGDAGGTCSFFVTAISNEDIYNYKCHMCVCAHALAGECLCISFFISGHKFIPVLSSVNAICRAFDLGCYL